MVSSLMPETKSTEGEGFLCCLESSFEVLCILTPLLRLSLCFVSRIMEGAGDGGGYIESGVSILVGLCFSTVDQQLSSTCNGLGCIVLNRCFPHDSYCTHSLIDKADRAWFPHRVNNCVPSSKFTSARKVMRGATDSGNVSPGLGKCLDQKYTYTLRVASVFNPIMLHDVLNIVRFGSGFASMQYVVLKPHQSPACCSICLLWLAKRSLCDRLLASHRPINGKMSHRSSRDPASKCDRRMSC